MLAGTASVAAIGGDVVSVTGTGVGEFADKNAGTNKSVAVAGYALAGADAGNYALVQPTGITATIARADLAVAGVSASGKTYDGTTAATLSGTASVSAIGGDVVSVAGAGMGAFSDKNAGSNKGVSVSGYTLTGTDAANYAVVQPAGLTASIGKAPLSVSGVSASGKTYDGTTVATLHGTASVTAIGGDVVSVAGTGVGEFADKNAGTNKSVAVAGYALAGADAGNYALVQPTGITATIARADLAVAGVSASGKTYDGTTAAALSGTASVSAIGGDVVSVAGAGMGAFSDKNAGSNKGVSVSGYTLTGTDAANYAVVQPAGLTASIGKASLTVSGVSASGKTYDGTTAATLSGIASVSAIGGDLVSVTGAGVGAFADKNAGTNKGVAVTGYALAGGDARNYALVQPTGLTATIGKAALAVAGVSASGKTYDGTNAAALNGTASVVAIGADVVSVTGTGVGAFADKNAGANKSVAVSGYALAGADAGNYTLVQPASVHATITPADLLVSGVTALGRTYDATTAATLAGTASVAAIAGDAVSVTGTGIGAFADKNAGAGKVVAVTGYTLSGADAGNYRLVEPTGVTATIARASLAVAGVTAVDKTYDAATGATLAGTATVTALGADSIAMAGTGTGTFADKNAGAGKGVSVSGYTLIGADAGNYVLQQPTGLVAGIGQATLAVSGIVARDKPYDGNTAAAVDASGAQLRGLLAGDAVSVSSSGAFSSAGAGNGKTVLLANVYGGADVGNYRIVDQASTVASIAAAPGANLVLGNTITQVQAVVLPPASSPAAAAPPLSSTLEVTPVATGAASASSATSATADGGNSSPAMNASPDAGNSSPAMNASPDAGNAAADSPSSTSTSPSSSADGRAAPTRPPVGATRVDRNTPRLRIIDAGVRLPDNNE